MQWEFSPGGKILVERNITPCLTSRVLHRGGKMFLCQSVFFTWWLMPGRVYTQPNRKVEMLSATSPAWQLICALWPFSILFTKGKHIPKTLFCLIKGALKTQRHYVLTRTCLTHSIYLVITESDCICAQPYKATWVSPTIPRSGALREAVLTQVPHISPHHHHPILPPCPQQLHRLRVPAETPLFCTFPGCRINRAGCTSTSSLERGTIVTESWLPTCF